jgi:hypothetical protein
MATDDKRLEIRYQVISAVGALILMLALGTVIFHYLEDWSWASSFYFTVVSLTTVGYGDLAPTTDATRVFTALFILAGVAVVVSAVAVIGNNYLENRGFRVKKRREGHEE